MWLLSQWNTCSFISLQITTKVITSSSSRVHRIMADPNAESCCQPLKEEFQRSKFSLHHEDPGVFCRSQWQNGERNLIWVLYRWLLAAFFAAGVIGSMMQDFNGGRWFIYLTDWGFTLCLFTCTYGAVIATIYYFNQSYFGEY